jgi:hypothetical protein
MKKESKIDYLQLETYIINIESNIKAIDFCNSNFDNIYKNDCQNEAIKIILDNSIEKINENLKYLNEFVYILRDYRSSE